MQSNRLFHSVWVCACAVTIVICIQLLRVPPLLKLPELPEGIETVIIGSSLTGRGLPFSAPNRPSSGATHVSWIVGGITDIRALQLAERAIEQGAREVFVEFSTFGQPDEQFATEPPPGIAGIVTDWFRTLTSELNQGIKALSGQTSANVWNAPKSPLLKREWEELRLIERRRKTLASPTEPGRLQRLIALADASAVRLVFYEPPRSASYVNWMSNNGQDWYGHLAGLAEALGLPLVIFGPSFEDEYFLDPTHLNEEGRERLTREFGQALGVF